MSIVYHLKSNAQKILWWFFRYWKLFFLERHFEKSFQVFEISSIMFGRQTICKTIKFNYRDQFLKKIMDEILNILVKQTPSWKMAAMYDFWVDHVLFVFNYIWTTNVQSWYLQYKMKDFPIYRVTANINHF